MLGALPPIETSKMTVGVGNVIYCDGHCLVEWRDLGEGQSQIEEFLA
jgi:prepilin-type processing-associated H-X9-DG protein